VETVITVAVIITIVIAGMFLIHRLNTQHDERITAFQSRQESADGTGRDVQAPANDDDGAVLRPGCRAGDVVGTERFREEARRNRRRVGAEVA
jgi:hypothetical protein